MRGRARYLWLAALLAIVCATVFLLMPRAQEVAVLTVERGDAVRALAVNGRIRPRQSVAVQPPVAGVVVELPHDVGNQVTAGALLARIDDGPQRAAIGEAAAAAAAQQAVLAQARRELARFEALDEFASRREVEERRLAVQEGARELQRRQAALAQAQEVQQRYVVRAPFAGVILERPVDRGQTVGPETVLYRLADLAAPEISADVDEAYAVELRTGPMALVKLPGRDRPARAEIVHIEPRVDEATGAREVRLRLLAPLASAPSGQTVSVNLIVERRPQAISIPRASILQPDTSPHVRIVDASGQVKERPIRFIDWPAAQVIVTQGLQAGMRILVNPEAAEPGDKVKPVTR
ncbi:efflux RND transporter periplasmic adaptor subunit [Novosphingobium sp. M1R2S20]|uniref:Efflux RND transporter periplasmic adaptor subunit n=1 Tax=Novosphingobium rhizovicinum TaxID=3228928 RepID=A0ABV3R7M6_9SPHN